MLARAATTASRRAGPGAAEPARQGTTAEAVGEVRALAQPPARPGPALLGPPGQLVQPPADQREGDHDKPELCQPFPDPHRPTSPGDVDSGKVAGFAARFAAHPTRRTLGGRGWQDRSRSGPGSGTA